MNKLVSYDLKHLENNKYVLGIDEVGRGCLAGPLVVCGIIMQYDKIIEGVNDSKKLSAKKREEIADIIIENSIDYFIVEVSVEDVDKDNIYQATKKAMTKIASKLGCHKTKILTDAMPLDMIEHTAIIKGDATSYSIACASIVAKVHRDKLLCELDKQYPEYDFVNNKGYGTKKHLVALDEYGYIDGLHRKTFEPIKSMCNKQLKLF